MELYNPLSGILLFAVWVTSAVMLLVAFAFSVKGNAPLASRIRKIWGAGAAVYAVALLVSAILPRGTSAMKTGVAYCDDDLCMTVLNVSKTPARDAIDYRFDVRLSSRANHGPRSAGDALVYLTDERKREFLPAEVSPLPFGVAVEPGKSADTSLIFHVPADAQRVSFAVRTPGIGYASFMIGGEVPWKPVLKLAVD